MKNIKNKFIPLLISIFAAVTLGLSGCMDLFDDSEVSTDRDVKYNVTYYNNGADIKTDVPVDLTDYVEDSIVTVLFDPLPEKTGNSFMGWYNPDADELYTAVGLKEFKITSSVKLRAKWNENTVPSDGIEMNVDWDVDPSDLNLYVKVEQKAGANNMYIECPASYECTWYVDGEDKTSDIGEGTVTDNKRIINWTIPNKITGDVDITLLIYDTVSHKTYSRTAHVTINKI